MIEQIAYYLSPYFAFYMLDLVLDYVVVLFNSFFDAVVFF